MFGAAAFDRSVCTPEAVVTALSLPLDLAEPGVSGFRARLDARGRLVVPAAVRDKLDLARGDTIEVLVRRGDADA